jgi:uncharacterized membrane protein
MSRQTDNRKIYTLRHWLFYAGVIVVAGSASGVVVAILELSHGLTLAVGATVGTVICTMALREDLFGPVPARRERRNRRA